MANPVLSRWHALAAAVNAHGIRPVLERLRFIEPFHADTYPGVIARDIAFLEESCGH